MNVASLPAILLTLAGWTLTALSAAAMLSGPYDGRTCQTECVQTLFFSGMATGILGLILGIVGLRFVVGRRLSLVSLWLSGPLCAIFAGLFLIGNLA